VLILLAKAVYVLLKPDNYYFRSLTGGASVKGKGLTLITEVP